MPILMLKKPADVSIDVLIDFFDAEFKCMGFKQGSKCEDPRFVEVLYTTQQSGCIRARYSLGQPFRIFVPEQITEFDLSFEFIQMSGEYEKKLIEFITAGRTY